MPTPRQITLKPGSSYEPSATEQANIRTGIGAAAAADLDTVTGDLAAALAALAMKAPLINANLTGLPTAPTAPPGTNTGQLATAAFVQAAVTALIDASPGALDTLNELAASLGNDADFAGTVTNALALKQLILAEGAFTDGDKTKLDSLVAAGAFGNQLLATGTKSEAATVLGIPSYATLDAANAGEALHNVLFFNTTLNKMQMTTSNS